MILLLLRRQPDHCEPRRTHFYSLPSSLHVTDPYCMRPLACLSPLPMTLANTSHPQNRLLSTFGLFRQTINILSLPDAAKFQTSMYMTSMRSKGVQTAARVPTQHVRTGAHREHAHELSYDQYVASFPSSYMLASLAEHPEFLLPHASSHCAHILNAHTLTVFMFLKVP